MRACTVAGLYWLVSPIMYVSPVALTASMIAAISSVVIAIGTAEYTCLPASRPWRTSGPCVQRWVKTATASTASDASIAS